MATTVYHGTSLDGALALLAGQSNRFGGLYVTETAALATRYANAVAGRVVDLALDQSLAPDAVVVTLETDEPVQWQRRPADHPSLDTVETTITTWTVRAVRIGAGGYPNTLFGPRGHYLRRDDIMARLVAALGDAVVIE